MRIVFYSHMSQLGNGATESLLGIVDSLSKRHECFVITPSKGTFTAELDKLNINNTVIQFKWSSNVNNDLNISCLKKSLENIQEWFSVRRFNRLNLNHHQKILQNFKPDIIYSNTSVINIGIMVAQKLKIKHVWHIREFQFYDIAPNFGSIYFKKYLKKSDIIIVNSNTLKSYYSRFIHKDKIEVVHNGISSYNNNIHEIVRGNKREVFIFLMIGSLIKSKSHFEALNAVKYLKNNNFRVQLKIVGEGRMRSEIEVFVKENNLEKHVILFGHQNNVGQFYSDSDCFLMCSKLESFGRVTVEAMLHSLPVIGRFSEYNATKEIIRDQIDGLLYKDDDQLIAKMKWMVNNPDLSVEMGKSGAERAREHFSLEKSISQIEKIVISFQNSYQ